MDMTKINGYERHVVACTIVLVRPTMRPLPTRAEPMVAPLTRMTPKRRLPMILKRAILAIWAIVAIAVTASFLSLAGCNVESAEGADALAHSLAGEPTGVTVGAETYAITFIVSEGQLRRLAGVFDQRAGREYVVNGWNYENGTPFYGGTDEFFDELDDEVRDAVKAEVSGELMPHWCRFW